MAPGAMPPPRRVLVTLLAPSLLLCCTQVVRSLSAQPPHDYGSLLDGMRLTGPFFDPHTSVNVTAQVGSHAYLDCIVRQLMDKSVSWVRNRDSHILTVDRYTFIADERFQCFHPADGDSWTLQIKYVQTRDAGRYECQVSTEPKIWRTVVLNVVVPRVEILGGVRDMYVNAESTLTIKCAIFDTVEPPGFTFWYHNNARLVPAGGGSGGGGRRRLELRPSADGTGLATLTIDRVEHNDSGNYTCSPSQLPSASVRLHVINGGQHAAMQDGVSGGRSCQHSDALWTVSVALFVTLCSTLSLRLHATWPQRSASVT